MSFFNKFIRYWHTIKHLKPIQILYRIYFILIIPSKIRTSEVLVKSISPTPIFFLRNKKSLISKNEFIFFNLKGNVDKIGWNPVNTKKLWIYNLHYFDHLSDLKSGNEVDWSNQIISKWIDENPSFKGIGWDSYPTSLRIINWVKWIMNANAFDSKMIDSLNTQTEWLYKRIEWHLLGNHLFSNAKALLFSSILLDGDSTNKWFTKAIKIIDKELKEQVLDDGGHFELSPMYHAIFLEDLLDIIQLTIAFPDRFQNEKLFQWKEVALTMISWLRIMNHSDGEIALFNDSAFNISLSLAELEEYALRLKLLKTIEVTDSIYTQNKTFKYQLNHLKDSGYLKLNDQNIDILIDVADVGPSYLPAHAHADTLSFELSYMSQRVFVNGGTSTYEMGDKRNKERMTSSHNTVVLNNISSSDAWSSFRMGRRAKPFDFKVAQQSNYVQVSCSHDGYKNLNSSPVHNREWIFKKNELIITDKIIGKYNSFIAHYILHPDVKITKKDLTTYVLRLKDGNEINMTIDATNFDLINFYYSPYFGESIATKAFMIESDSNNIICNISWK